ncbi:MAG: Rv2175c family DNA-binding protein [Actinomycetota bacterium]|nr:Rv2175c family DNA-binding protein [Actinomycetota bacterium]
MSDPSTPVPIDADRASADPDLAELVGEWTTVPDIAERYRLPLARVRQLIADRELLSMRVGERRVVSIPAKFLGDDGPRPELKGTFTVLADGGMDDGEILRWLFTPDETLPVKGAPIDALIGGFKTEVRRRAQVEAL